MFELQDNVSLTASGVRALSRCLGCSLSHTHTIQCNQHIGVKLIAYVKYNRICNNSVRRCSFVHCVKTEMIRVCLLEQGLDDEIRNELGECDLSDVS